ncbi:LysM peptidoglycan-binding domain-containing protein [Stappia stellulata]|uniref:LysM peptidoglycan-binding domain-containing protein n=1 Tax=Stappia stellulata TaxID=71235 RepID=UPI00041C3F8C|nr:Ig-like domain-containing protein [Stappia stellulata]
MSRKVVVQLLILAGIVGVGALGVGLWQLQQERGGERIATGPSDVAPRQGDARNDTGAASPSASAPAASESPVPETSQTTAAGDEGEAASSSRPVDTATAKSAAEPTFDLMRVEPDGSTVVAGRSEAGAIVALLSNGKVIGKGIANAAGEFAIVLDTPLDPGAHAVTLETQDEAGAMKSKSRQSMAVSVPENSETGDVLVMLNEPGAPSQVLQKPETAETADTTPPTETDAPAQELAALDRPSPETAGDPAPSGTATRTSPADTPLSDPARTPEGDTASAPTMQAPETPDTQQPPAQTAQAAQSSSAPAGEAPGDMPARPDPAGENGPASADRLAQPLRTGPAADGETPQVTVEAVETEDSKVFVAGAGEPDSDVRVYFDNTLIGETTTDSKGRWLMETENEIAPGEVDVRADQIVPDSGTVVARAQVTFEKAEDAIVLRPLSATGTAGAGAGASASTGARQIPNIIIRSGDNLWTISQRRYGEGLRYTTIYQANRDQIRNPDLIYPGQVFMMPEGDRNWPAAN